MKAFPLTLLLAGVTSQSNWEGHTPIVKVITSHYKDIPIFRVG